MAGAQAVDVGASTGGFTDVLLRRGASRVVAVDVGRGQLRPTLRADPRVESLEGVHWKTLSLTVAPGPFDFFTVDVSFTAARTMLRGLAFRLRPGAEGVVLVKPQFELPDEKVREGRVTDPALRALALTRFREKAEALGFELLAHADSPVEIESGTVEILTHLRFQGRSERLPRPGERRRGPDEGPRPRATTLPARLHAFAVVPPGEEPLVAAELRALEEVSAVREVPGGVELTGPPAAIVRANLWLRAATRVLVRLGEVEAENFAVLRRRVRGLPWAPFIDARAARALHVSQTGSRLYHTGAVAETLELAIADALPAAETDPERPAVGVYARGVKNRWTLSVDSSGELLHRRGARIEGAHAPLRETLAAALLLHLGWDPATPLVDPMCGAGTFALEAASLAARRAPGLERPFACEAWPGLTPGLVARLRGEARACALPPPEAPRIVASDRDPDAVEAARRNLARAGLDAWVTLTARPLEAVEAPPGPGLVLVNPPYGKRVGDPRELPAVYRALGRLLKSRFRGWRAAVLLADRRLAPALGLPISRRTPFWNGGLRVELIELALG